MILAMLMRNTEHILNMGLLKVFENGINTRETLIHFQNKF